MRQITCACGHLALKRPADINRAAKRGRPIYCTRECAGAARRLENPPTEAERRAAKAAYDAAYRERNATALKAKRAAYYARTADREKEAAYRREHMQRHIEYCRRPEYRQKKSEYDRVRRAQQQFGPFWESALLALDIDAEVKSRIDRFEIYQQNGTLNKKLNRRRDYERQTFGR